MSQETAALLQRLRAASAFELQYMAFAAAAPVKECAAREIEARQRLAAAAKRAAARVGSP